VFFAENLSSIICSEKKGKVLFSSYAYVIFLDTVCDILKKLEMQSKRHKKILLKDMHTPTSTLVPHMFVHFLVIKQT
jgi:hypothetical protein